eukprot:380679-Pyramimonas_sp.AAC.1
MKRSSILLVGLVVLFTLYSFMSSTTKMDERLRSDLRQRVAKIRHQMMHEGQEHPLFQKVRVLALGYPKGERMAFCGSLHIF